ncbi:MAG: hypothetical protein LBC71_00510 [Oscillospiraceae bacterium]|jgi:signal transduction histidine kinase|nr:hypothetical protein [Oscillospiraceae bacterium]
MSKPNKEYDDLIQELQDTKTSLEEALEHVNKASMVKNEFLDRMSHEMRTPMNAIMGMAQIAKVSTSPEKISMCIDKIYESSQHMMRLISNVLDVSSGIHNFADTEFSLDSIMDYVMTKTSSQLAKKRQKLTINIDDKIPNKLLGDEKRITQVIIHLLTNASAFSDDEEEITLDVVVLNVGKKGGKLTVEFIVTDHGIGITEENQKNLFVPFEMVDGSFTRSQGGIGLGLALSKYIVEMMGGKIWVDSEFGKGSRFGFTVTLYCDPKK